LVYNRLVRQLLNNIATNANNTLQANYLLVFLGLEGQLFAINLLDEGLYFSLNGPTFRFPAVLNNIELLRSFMVNQLILSVSAYAVVFNVHNDTIL